MSSGKQVKNYYQHTKTTPTNKLKQKHIFQFPKPTIPEKIYSHSSVF